MTPTAFKTVTVTAQNQFTDPVVLDRSQSCAISIVGGTFTNTTKVTLQRRYNPTADWRDIANYTTPTEIDYIANVGMEVRVGVKTGNFTNADSILIDMKVG